MTKMEKMNIRFHEIFISNAFIFNETDKGGLTAPNKS